MIPPSFAGEVADAAITQEHEEMFIAEMVAHGHSMEGLFPLDAHWRAWFSEWAIGHPNPAARP